MSDFLGTKNSPAEKVFYALTGPPDMICRVLEMIVIACMKILHNLEFRLVGRCGRYHKKSL